MTSVLHCYILFIVISCRVSAECFTLLRKAHAEKPGLHERYKYMHIIIHNASMVPVYEQLMGQIKQEIISGELPEGSNLPSVRSFANELKISALTVKKAYDKLEEEGFVVTVHGKGTFVAATDRQLAVEARRKAVEEDFSSAIAKAKSVGLTNEEIREILDLLLEES